MRSGFGPTMLLLLAACSTPGNEGDPSPSNFVTVAGTIEVLSAGTRSETVILHDDASGETIALVGEDAALLRGSRGVIAIVTGRFTTGGWSLDPELRKLWVVEYSEGGDFSTMDRYED